MSTLVSIYLLYGEYKILLVIRVYIYCDVFRDPVMSRISWCRRFFVIKKIVTIRFSNQKVFCVTISKTLLSCRYFLIDIARIPCVFHIFHIQELRYLLCIDRLCTCTQTHKCESSHY